MAFNQRRVIRFDEVDFARVVYFPQFFAYCHQTFEDFFAAEVGLSYAKHLTDRSIGFPVVHAEGDFRTPLRFGDAVDVELANLEVGSSSLTNRFRFSTAQGARSAELRIKVVATDLRTFGKTALPEDVKAAFARHRTTTA